MKTENDKQGTVWLLSVAEALRKLFRVTYSESPKMIERRSLRDGVDGGTRKRGQEVLCLECKCVTKAVLPKSLRMRL